MLDLELIWLLFISVLLCSHNSLAIVEIYVVVYLDVAIGSKFQH